MKIVFIVGSLAQGRDGVGDYARSLAQECVRQGHSCALLSIRDQWVLGPEASSETVGNVYENNIQILRIPQIIPDRERTLLTKEFLASIEPDWVSLQFVPYSFQNKGIVHKLATFLRPLLTDYRVHIMFHELWIGAHTYANLWERLIGLTQKYYILHLIRSINPLVIHTSNSAYVTMLSRCGVHADILPLFGNIPLNPVFDEKWFYEECRKLGIDFTKADRSNWWVFGFFGSLSSAWPSEPLFSQIHQAAITSGRKVIIASAGRLGDENYWTLLVNTYSDRFHFLKFGELPADLVSQYLQFLDFGIAATAHNLIGKSGVAATMMEHGLLVIVNRDDWYMRNHDKFLRPHSSELLYKPDGDLKQKLLESEQRKLQSILPITAKQFITTLSMQKN